MSGKIRYDYCLGSYAPGCLPSVIGPGLSQLLFCFSVHMSSVLIFLSVELLNNLHTCFKANEDPAEACLENYATNSYAIFEDVRASHL